MSLVGRVIGTEDSTPLLFSVALAPDSYLQLDGVVITVRGLPPMDEQAEIVDRRGRLTW